jgi:hypothetical protein
MQPQAPFRVVTTTLTYRDYCKCAAKEKLTYDLPRVGPHVPVIEGRIAALAAYYESLGGWKNLGAVHGGKRR